MVARIRPDKVHGAAYSTRPGTIASRTLEDDVPKEEKMRRLKQLDQLQESILQEINAVLVGQNTDVLVDARHKGKWQGRTRNDKLVFFEDDGQHLGDVVTVNITRASAWSLQGELAPAQSYSTTVEA